MEIITDEQLLNAKDEAIDPDLSRDYVEFGDGDSHRRCKVRLLPMKIERRIKKAVAEHLPLLEKLDNAGYEAMSEVFDAASDVLPDIVAMAFGHESVSREWLEDNASHEQQVRALLAVLKKQGLSDALGKLLRRGVQRG